MKVLSAIRQAAGLAVGGAVLALMTVTYEGCGRFGATPYLYAAGAVLLAALPAAAAEREAGERLQAGALAGVFITVAAVLVLILVFAGDDCTGA